MNLKTKRDTKKNFNAYGLAVSDCSQIFGVVSAFFSDTWAEKS